MNSWIFGKGKKKRNTLRKTVRVLEDKLSDVTLLKDERKQTLDEIEQISKVQNGRTETRSNVLKIVGTVGILAFAAVMGHRIEKSDQIVQNKNSFNLFSRLGKF